MLGATSCRKDDIKGCSEQPSSASFKVNSTDFSSLEVKTWLSNGAQQSLFFMQEFPNGNQHVVNVIFVGETIGSYPLLGINATNRASYFAPGINGTTFPDTIIPGILVITNFDNEPSCLAGHYSFKVDTLEISGEFQSLRPE